MWLAPFSENKVNLIEINFDIVRAISMIRIWNYNKSRIHSFRGVKDITIELDGLEIFKGSIKKAPGTLPSAEEHCEYILFTQNLQLLEKIDQNDWLNRVDLSGLRSDKEDNAVAAVMQSGINRPHTGSKEVSSLNKPKNDKD